MQRRVKICEARLICYRWDDSTTVQRTTLWYPSYLVLKPSSSFTTDFCSVKIWPRYACHGRMHIRCIQCFFNLWLNASLLFLQGQYLLDNLVDCTKTLHFEMELSAPIDKRTQLTSIRREARRARMNSGDSSEYGMMSIDINKQQKFYSITT